MKSIILSFIMVCFLASCDFPPSIPRDFKKLPPIVKDIEIVTEEQIALAESIVWPKPKKVKLSRDVFEPLVETSGGYAQQGSSVRDDVDFLVLSGTLVSENSVAFIYSSVEEKSYVVHTGDLIGQYQVVNISRKGVTLRKKGKDYYLKILEATP